MLGYDDLDYGTGDRLAFDRRHGKRRHWSPGSRFLLEFAAVAITRSHGS